MRHLWLSRYLFLQTLINTYPDSEFIARAKADPGKLTFGSPGHGAVPHLSAELFVRAAKIEH